MTLGLTLINSYTVGSGGASSITFSSIPSTYTDLKLVLSSRSSRTNDAGGSDGKLQFNGDSGSNYASKFFFNASGSLTYSSNTYIWFMTSDNTQTANTFGSAEFYIPNYASSAYKSVSIDSTAENNSATNYQGLVVGYWTGTSAINSITVTDNNGGYMQYTTAYLYGITNH